MIYSFIAWCVVFFVYVREFTKNKKLKGDLYEARSNAVNKQTIHERTQQMAAAKTDECNALYEQIETLHQKLDSEREARCNIARELQRQVETWRDKFMQEQRMRIILVESIREIKDTAEESLDYASSRLSTSERETAKSDQGSGAEPGETGNADGEAELTWDHNTGWSLESREEAQRRVRASPSGTVR